MHLDAKERLGDTQAPATLADDHSDAVRIMSIHASKGLEFPIVVVPELAARGGRDSQSVRLERRDATLALALKTPADEDGESRPGSAWFSAFSAQDALADAEESARVLYVAFTRAKEALLVSGAMTLRPKQRSTANNDLARLARILGLDIPVGGPSDAVVSVPGGAASCRLRVIDAVKFDALEADSAERIEGPRMPPPAGPITEDVPRAVAPSRLSYTQLSEFEHCPRQFWVRRVLGIREEDSSERGGASPLSFGTALHTVLRLVDSQGRPPQAARIESIGRYFELSEADATRLAEAVQRYCESDVARRASGGELVRRESPFSMRVGGRFLLTGSIDLYSRTGDAALVVDYKSGATGELGDLEARYRLQAECYALAVLGDGCDSVVVEFVRPEVQGESGAIQRTTFAFKSADAERIETDLLLRYSQIEGSVFDPAPSRDCVHCTVAFGLCPHVAHEA
jgi:ATP-dependent helicase/nuclease subunit A